MNKVIMSPGYIKKVEQDTMALQDGLAIVSDGNTHGAIPAGSFVFVKNHDTLTTGLYTNTSGDAIEANATLSNSNLTADASGGLNTLNSNLSSYVPTSNFAIVEGYVQAGGGNTIVPYPTGYSQYTCCVVATYSDLFGTRYNSESTCYSSLESNGVNLHLPGGGSGTALVRAALMKTGI